MTRRERKARNAKRGLCDDGMKPDNKLVIEQIEDEPPAVAVARKLLEPELRNAMSASLFANKVLGDAIQSPGIMDCVKHTLSLTEHAVAGDLTIVSRTLVSQAMTLDSMFTEFARRAAINMGDFPQAAERYGRLAMKAQTNCRTTLDALTKLHQPSEQTVKHVHVNEGAQAVVADQFHAHNYPGPENGNFSDQPHRQGSSGSALLGQDPAGNGVPVPSREGEEAMPVARRRERKRSAKG